MVGRARPIWSPDRFRLFLSHISAEKEYVAAIKLELAKSEVDGFVAHEDIEPTRDWQDTIEQALAECQALVAFLHPGFHDSLWTDQEVGFVRSRGALIIPVRLGRDPYGFIGRYQGLRGHDDPAEMAQAIVGLLLTHDFTAADMGLSVVRTLETAPSFDAARSRARYAREYQHWTPASLERLATSIEVNRQVRDANGVPEVIRGIIAEHRDRAASEEAASRPEDHVRRNDDEWWREPGAPTFRLGLAASRGDPPWTYEATIHQQSGEALGVIQAGWTGPSVPERLQPQDVEPRRAGEWRLLPMRFDPLDRVAEERS